MIVSKIILIFLLGSVNALFSYFLDYCFWKGSIFGKWLPFLAKINLKIFNPKALLETKDNEDLLIDYANQMPFYKVLGGCIVCTNVYIGLGSYIVVHHLLHISWWYMIPYLLVSSFVIRKII